jgi:hypothetical protein
MSASNRAFATFRPTTSHASAINASFSSAVILLGVGKRLRKSKNHSLRLLCLKRSISGKYSGR